MPPTRSTSTGRLMKRQRDRLKGVQTDRSLMSGSADRTARGTRVALFLLVLMVTGPAAAGSEALLPDTEARVNVVDGVPALMCGDELCPAPDRWPDRAERHAEEAYGWWLRYGPDLDGNGMDDRLQRVLDGAPSVSPTAIEGADGRLTVAIVVDFAWHPEEADVDALRDILDAHGWVGEEGGAWFDDPESLDSIVLDRVPVSALLDIWRLEGVVVVEMQNLLVPTNDVASKAIRARDSDVYAGEVHPTGLTGDGVVIAVLDTGVDNEHRSLNDFDDASDAPDLDPLSYDDHKWVAGFDATSTSSNPDGSQDPDDGQGHGTHVAGSALGTGDASRQHTGTAPGAYLVDVKVLTDAGGTNSQYSISGIQWVVNNANTDWGHNGSSKGIQVASMSFGSFSSPLNPDDTGDNGSSAEARQVNNAVDAGVVCVIAMGNDGARRVPSPASADKGIAISAANDRNTINRTDDSTASYTNYGPRDDDGDDDELDELKPDVASYGTGITSATAATGTTFPGQPDRPKADSGYDSKDGTSMATPLASGVVALMLEADPSLEPDEVKQVLHDSADGAEARANHRSTRTGTKNGDGASSTPRALWIWCSNAPAHRSMAARSSRHLPLETGMEITWTSPPTRTEACFWRVTASASKAASKTRPTAPTRKWRCGSSNTVTVRATPWSCLIGAKQEEIPRRGTLTSPSTTTGWTRTRITRSSLPEPAPTAEMCRPPMCGG